MPEISIITPSYNQGAFIKDTLDSVQQQQGVDVEHIVVDACSSDQTIEILKSTTGVRWVSEPDSGQSNAINKGFEMANADIVGWLNSDDYYVPDTLKLIIDTFNRNPDIDVVYGDLEYVDKNAKPLLVVKGDVLNLQSLSRNPDLIRQPSMFFRKTLWVRQGKLREDLDLVFDYNFFLRAIQEKPFLYIPMTIARYRHYTDTKTMKRLRGQALELIRVVVETRVVNYVVLIGCLLRLLGSERLRTIFYRKVAAKYV